MTWHWSAAVGFALASCGGAGRAVPTEVEIDWPDAASSAQGSDAPPGGETVDAGVAVSADGQATRANDAAQADSD